MTNVIPDNIAYNSNKTIVFIESIKILSIIVIILTVVIKYKGILNKLQNWNTKEIKYIKIKNINEVIIAAVVRREPKRDNFTE